MEDPKLTLYPKITNHIHEIMKKLQYRQYKQDDAQDSGQLPTLPPLPIIGTVKLHGTHADIIVSHAPSNAITFQSRNNPNLLVSADNHSFATIMTSKTSAILSVRDQYLARWRELNPSSALDLSIPVTIAGEWIGPKIQKGVAISKLSLRLVIISVKINGEWIPDSKYPQIEAPDNNIYNISRGGYYHATILPGDGLQQTKDELETLAEKVAAQCPFAASFGISGEGEGLVWKLADDSLIGDCELWFKTKGGRFKPTFTPAPKKPATDNAAKEEQAKELAQAWCSEGRLEQGWDYLREMGTSRDMKGIGEYLKWVQRDVFTEEKGFIEENKVDEGALRIAVVRIAKTWYLDRLGKGEE